MIRHARPLLAILVATGAAWSAGGTFRVPLMKQPPTLDGKIEPDEWAVSAGFDGFHFNGKMQRRRVRGFIGATRTHIYVAILSRLPDEGALLAKMTRDSLKVVYDDAVEVFVNPTPDAEDKADYQFLANWLGKGGYNIHFLGQPGESVSWRGGWRQAHGFHDGWWHFECAVPLASMKMAGNRKTTEGVWAINLCRDWKNPWEWSSLTGGYTQAGARFTFTASPAPAVQYAADGDPFLGGFAGKLRILNPSAQPLALKAQIVLDRNNMPAVRVDKALTLAPGAAQTLALAAPADDPTTRYTLSIKVASPDGGTVYYDRTTSWPRAQEPYRWLVGKEQERPPVDFQFAYYPYRNKMRLVVDVGGLPKAAKPTEVLAQIRTQIGKKLVKTVVFPMAGFKDGRASKTIELPPLDGLYEIAMKAKGERVSAGETVKTFERKRFPWEHTPTGRSTKVYPPFTPIELSGATLKTVLREHTLNGFGLLDQVQATSANTGITKPILAGPMRYVVMADGQEQAASAGPIEVVSNAAHQAVLKGRFQAGQLAATWRQTWDYDGCAKVELTLLPSAGRRVDALRLEIPFSNASATHIHANADRIRAPVAQRVPEGEGVLWDATKCAYSDYTANFCPYVFVGTPVRGICWFAENDLGWSWNPDTPNMEVVRSGSDVVLRIHLINQPIVIRKPRTITFGLLAAPVKPRLVAPGKGKHWWRYRYLRDNYTLLGTDVNWLSIGTCGSFYPAGKDLYLWEMLKRGNEQKLSRETIKMVEEWGKQYVEPYGPARVEKWVRHVRYNLQSRYGKKMIFYYNRASHQGCEEFETFKDEWCLTDLRTIGKGNGLREIKVVPSPSYIDFNLYWYARSFEIGGNRGVYWDNFYFAPSFNTEETAAYKRGDGSIVPSTGVWGLRELAKRTFVMLNERGMLPITFPHMTSFSPLPLLAFATVQYDWEWKYSLGDVQTRHSRDYLLMASTGELAGVWPVPLGDHGKLARDPWTQRTFIAVRLVHELDGYGGFGLPWVKEHVANRKLAEPILDMLDKDGLKVYKYWEDRPLPVATGRPDLPAIVYCVPGQEAVAAIVSYARQDEQVALKVDADALGFGDGYTVTDVETGKALSTAGGAIRFPLKKHDVRVLRFAARGK